ncbi:MAG: hypothetical protein KC416_05650 [Myxococcales bacterium]|nr:hypothetical protein [Myxococcales bacterium]
MPQTSRSPLSFAALSVVFGLVVAGLAGCSCSDPDFAIPDPSYGDGGAFSLPPETPDGGPALSCVEASDCGSTAYRCSDGKCELDPMGCASNTDCQGGTCVDGSCRQTLCQFDFECGSASKMCVNGACFERCEAADDPCPTGQACDVDAGRCKNLPKGAILCEDNTECGSGEVCINTECLTACLGVGGGECGQGRRCTDGVCRVDDRPKPFCKGADDCLSGPCVKGVCRTTCETTTECKKYDHQFAACDSGYCITTQEALSDCALDRDCPETEQCVNGQCAPRAGS